MATRDSKKYEDQIRRIRAAYDKTVDDYRRGIKEEDLLPEKFKKSARYQSLKKRLKAHPCGSDNSRIREYLAPRKGLNFLDVGSCANLIGKKLQEWPSKYYGIDISPKLIEASRNFATRNRLKIGGLFVADAAQMPFENGFFDLCAVIGVLEYYDLSYIKKALKELRRVLKPQGKIVVDMPNFRHPDCRAMIELEGYLGRTRKNVSSNKTFEAELEKSFFVEKIDDSRIMTIYFARAKKPFGPAGV